MLDCSRCGTLCVLIFFARPSRLGTVLISTSLHNLLVTLCVLNGLVVVRCLFYVPRGSRCGAVLILTSLMQHSRQFVRVTSLSLRRGGDSFQEILYRDLPTAILPRDVV